MNLQRNYYEVLGVPPQASIDQIKKKYRELARRYHPDLIQDKALGQRVFTQINKAYRILGDPDRRAQYDMTLEAEAASRASTLRAGTTTPSMASTASPVAPASGATGGASPSPQRPAGVQAARPQPAAGVQTARPQPAGPVPPDIARVLSDAEMALMQGNPQIAKGLCDTLLRSDPRNVKALALQGDALAQMGRVEEAKAAYQAALAVTPSPLLQSKLDRLNQATPRPAPAASPAAPNPNRPNPDGADQGTGGKPSGGLFGKIWKKK